MRFTAIRMSCLSATLVAAALTLPFATAAQANIVISIDKSAQQMSVAVDGAERYTWPVSTGRPGYDTPNGTFKPNRMDADHFSQEWDNAPMPHTMFFDLHGHAIHGFSDIKHLGLAVSHGCVRLSPDHAATLYSLVKAQGMGNTSVIISGRTPGGDNAPVARTRLPDDETVYSAQPVSISPQYQQQQQYQPQQQYQQSYQPQQQYQRQPYPPQYQQPQQPEYAQQQPQFPPQPPPYYGRPVYGQQGYYVQPQPQPYYGQPAYPPPQPYYGPPPYQRW
jgi:L,D-transpeptidase catalytic domain